MHIVFSGDAMNKILVGDVLCVSRYHQIRKLYMVEDRPITKKDHDFPMGYKIIPYGKMPLMKKGVFLQDIFGEVISSTTSHESDIYEYDNVKVDTGYDTDACVVDVDDALASNEGKVERADDTMSINSNIIDKTTNRSCQNDVDFSNDASSIKYKVDKLGRKHIKYPRTGPVLVFNRNAQFHTQTMEAHANDFLPLLSTAVQRGRTFIVCVAGQSAYNMIEHAWPPLSNRLTSVKLPATLHGEDKPPNKQVLEKEEREEKEKRILDNDACILAK